MNRQFVAALCVTALVAGALPARAQQRKPALPKGLIGISGTFTPTTQTLSASASPRVNAETATISVASDIPSAAGVSASAFVRIWKQLAVGGAFARYQSSSAAIVSGSIPHPFVFSQPRQFEGTINALNREETSMALHAGAMFAPSNRFLIAVFGGPVRRSLTQDVVTSVSYSEAYPYDTATLQSTAVSNVKRSAWGFGAGADATYFVSRQVGIGATINFDGGNETLPSILDSSIESKTGGVHVGVGVRFRF